MNRENKQKPLKPQKLETDDSDSGAEDDDVAKAHDVDGVAAMVFMWRRAPPGRAHGMNFVPRLRCTHFAGLRSMCRPSPACGSYASRCGRADGVGR